MIFLVTDIDEPQGVSSDSPWVAKLSVNSALAAEGSNKVSSCVKYLNSVVISVGNNILSNFVNGHTGQAIEFTLTIAITAKAEPVLTLFTKLYIPSTRKTRKKLLGTAILADKEMGCVTIMCYNDELSLRMS